MGWMQKCYETYENNARMVGRPVEGSSTLCPLFFMSNKAQIEITITEEGKFYEAKPIPKDDADTLIPVTEDSAGRTSSSAAHPLCDQLQYIAMGHSSYPDSEKYRKKYELYRNEIKSWADSDFSNLKVRAVCKYCLDGTVISDLCSAGVVNCDAGGKLAAGKIEGTAYEKCLVRWRVLTSDGSGGSSTWQDQELFESYRNYHLSRKTEPKSGVCYVTGEDTVLAKSHPKGTISFSYGAKLLSANDSSGFTYRGRFIDPDEALSVGEEATQKAHSALRWVTANQGVFYGGRAFVCWNPNGKKVLQPDILSSLGAVDSGAEAAALTMPEYREKLNKAISGYSHELDDADDVEIIALDAATTGRLSVTYYNELRASDFLGRLHDWGETCCWYFTAFTPEKKPYSPVRTPSASRIVTCAFGTQQDEMLKCDDKVLKEHAQRILHCIIDKKPVPSDIVRALVTRAAAPQSYNRTNYETLLSVACAMVRKYRNQKYESEDWKMELDPENKDRSYLFGRLLAVAEKVERQTYSREESGREPNAARLQSAFVSRPMRTWATLEKALTPYYAKLKPGSRKFYKDLAGEIVANFGTDDSAKLNRPLEDVYLMGYYLQRKELNTYKQEDE
jgi:CRISPR-associated protein, Csd1 family